ncbi:MAG: transporter substrate-binding domain-containing protein [Rhodobacteraceae bacterium]|nr:transporter substrate-binding domain-containing protein [Paracoccaceae bacterium]
MKLRTVLLSCVAAVGLAATAIPASAKSLLETARERGNLICGSSQGTPGFGAPDSNGYWRGLDIDICRAVAVAVFGDKDKVQFVPLTGQQRIPALQTGEVDVLPRTFTWTLSRSASGIDFTTPNFYDYTGFMVKKDLGVTKAEDLKGASVCVQTGSTTEIVVEDVSRQYDLGLKTVVFDNTQGTRQAFFSGRCDALITDASALASVRATMAKNPDDYIIFPATKYMEALTPAVRSGDDQWRKIVFWSIEALEEGELLGITSQNIDSFKDSKDPAVRRFLGLEPGLGTSLGLSDDFAANIIRQLGNYGQIFDRTVGKDSPLKIERGPNALYSAGGLMFPMAFE